MNLAAKVLGHVFPLWKNCLNHPRVTVASACVLLVASASTVYPNPTRAPGARHTKPPPQAAAVGYTLNSYSSTFSADSIALAGQETPGFQWYSFHFFGDKLPDPSGIAFNADGSMTLGTEKNMTIATATPAPKPYLWSGLAFGGGAYFEAFIKFDPANTVAANGRTAWPAFWSMSVEHLAGLPAEHWPGQPPNFNHFIEIDFFEYDIWSFSPHNYFGGAIHDWSNIWNTACPTQYCGVSNAGGGGTKFSNFQVRTPAATDFTAYHKFGLLWVPATATSNGYAQYYFDDQPTNDKVTWTQFQNEPPPPGLAPWTFGVVDKQHLVLILSTGAKQPMTVQSVNVWQASTANNWKQ